MAVTVSVFAILLADIWSLGILSWAGESLNLIVVTMPAILAVTTMTQAMHLLSYYHDLAQPAGPADYRMRAGWWWIAVKSTFLPNFYCAISTAAGFASLGTSQIPPVKVMGLITAAGVMLSFGLCYTLVPALLSLSSRVLPRGAGAHPWWTLELSKGYVSWLERRWTAIVGVAVVCFLLALGGLRLLRAESHVLELFSPGDRIPVRRAMSRAPLKRSTNLPGLSRSTAGGARFWPVWILSSVLESLRSIDSFPTGAGCLRSTQPVTRRNRPLIRYTHRNRRSPQLGFRKRRSHSEDR
jgi:hypothetical protein